ncbi:MAG: 30S ribosome-binding factor RbfA [Crocinitomicaceae bacterium]|nr:30S ribosome-binding factor RbfA [Crocinitomicaceae bacterium]
MSIRQNKIANEIQRALSVFFQQETNGICKGSMVSVTVVRITPDLSLAKIYVSIFAGPEPEEVLENINANMGQIRGYLGNQLNGMRKIPELMIHIDDSLDYAEEIDELLKK